MIESTVKYLYEITKENVQHPGSIDFVLIYGIYPDIVNDAYILYDGEQFIRVCTYATINHHVYSNHVDKNKIYAEITHKKFKTEVLVDLASSRYVPASWILDLSEPDKIIETIKEAESAVKCTDNDKIFGIFR